MKRLFLLFITLCLFLTGCTETAKEKKPNNKQLTVYTTVYPLQYFTERIGGDYVDVKTIYPAGADEHTFEPTQKDMIELSNADVFIYIGLGLEGFVEKAKNTLKNQKVIIAAAGEQVHFETDNAGSQNGHQHGHGDDGHNHSDIDPHVWLDPIYSIDLAKAIKINLSNKMPEHKDQFEANFNDLSKELKDLNADFENLTSHAKHKEIIVAHAAFGYWEKRYGIQQISISGLNSANEPSQKELEKVISEAKKHGLKYVFFEQNVSSKLTEIIQNEINAQPLQLHNLSTLTSEDIKNNKDYFSLMKENLDALKKALNS